LQFKGDNGKYAYVGGAYDQRPNLRHLCDPLVGTEGLIKTVGFKKTTESIVVKNKQVQLSTIKFQRNFHLGSLDMQFNF